MSGIKEHPILFSAPMVRAILAGAKTQTRRVVHRRHLAQINLTRGPIRANWSKPMPYGQPGDRLWVRETWSREFEGGVCYRADDAPGEVAEFVDAQGNPIKGSRWKPSIHMPRWASRITLEITGVRVERLQDISEADAQAEGCALECMTPTGDDSGSAIWGPGGYIALWESLNGPGSWEANPWVWVIEFKRVNA